jgi:hypothetical protein
MSTQKGQIHREAPQNDEMPLCKENVGMVGAEKHLITLQTRPYRPDPLKIFGLCSLVQSMPKDETELCDRIKKKLPGHMRIPGN